MSAYSHRPEIHNLRAPGVIAKDLVQFFSPGSVIDVGCGIGTFLKVFLDHGISDVLGLDGAWVDRKKLYIDDDLFTETDLERPIELRRRFDLALCLEVGEHLGPNTAETLVSSLCNSSDIIVFSAAVPGQGGENHINEQPFSYWQDKFADRGYAYYDLFRKRYWEDERIDWWYRQNMFLVANQQIEFDEPIRSTKIVGRVQTAIHPELVAGLRAELDRLETLMADLTSPSGAFKLASRKLRRAISLGKSEK